MRSLIIANESDRAGDPKVKPGHKSGSYDLISPSREPHHLKTLSLEAGRCVKALLSGVSEEVEVATTGGCR